MSGFLGRYQTTLDSKGRFALPAKLRSATDDSGKPLLNNELVLTKGLEGCLALYASPEWTDIQHRFSALNFTQRDFRHFSRRFYSSAAAVTPDRSGRILIPAHLIAEAHLGKDLLVIGVNRWIEIWNPDRYKYYMEQFAGSYEDAAERLFSGDVGTEE